MNAAVHIHIHVDRTAVILLIYLLHVLGWI
jgi:hypothetical protein